MKVNALLDDGCTAAALISAEVAENLRLEGKKVVAHTEGVGGKVTSYDTLLAPVELLGEQGGAQLLLAQVMKKPAGNYKPVDWTKHQEAFTHLRPPPLPVPVSGRGINVLVGNAHPQLMASLEEVVADSGLPVARRTMLGWTVAGPTGSDSRPGEEALLVAEPLEQSPESVEPDKCASPPSCSSSRCFSRRNQPISSFCAW